ncbi:T9SS C-terminal target domain-containing protein [Hymenobacter oligotrophus]|uniref:T9SS C-terminal target domain-containing protein n=1 Tax=Hymenobacter oligotrophus TaxID=2319843 RepID=A0A3B7R8A5_9BACT|nr:serine hydrolase [Hymenobacter oligotrophus]AYA37351.1 T9SS C-terminal target domain-containing protein [Hymenobacter oligotrophus]
MFAHLRLGLLLVLLLAAALPLAAQNPQYFPPTSGTTWAATTPQSLGWCQPQLDTLLNYLASKRTKSLIVLKDGRMVVEQYYGTYTRDSLWYWASAGKSLTATLVGIAQQEGLLSLSDSTSKYLGRGWSAAPASKERLITVRHQLSMTTGLDDTPPPPCDNETTSAGCLRYLADAGTRWAYHTGPYRLLQDVIARASGLSINQYTNQRLASRIGMSGLWYNDVYYSRARDMARFGLLILNRGTWEQTPVLSDAAYFQAMTTPSQAHNRSYGYLWWLNGQQSHMLPTSQLVFNGPMVPTAPTDMIAALGKNDQKIYVVPSLGLVVVRQGQSAGASKLAVSSFDAELWRRLMAAMQCRPLGSRAGLAAISIEAYPQPAAEQLTVNLPAGLGACSLQLRNSLGQVVQTQASSGSTAHIGLNHLPNGVYVLQVRGSKGQLFATRRIVH